LVFGEAPIGASPYRMIESFSILFFLFYARPAFAFDAEMAARQRALLEAHRFVEARDLERGNPGAGLLRVPDRIIEPRIFFDAPGRYYELSPDGDTLSLKSLDVSSGFHILVRSEPDKKELSDAFARIDADPSLSSVFIAWSALFSGAYEFDAVAGWNASRFPGFRLIHSESDWPEIPRPSVLSFTFIRDGGRTCHVEGWRGELTIDALRACAKDAGLFSRSARLETALRVLALRSVDRARFEEFVSAFKREYLGLRREGAFGKAKLARYDTGELLRAYDAAYYFTAFSPVKDGLPVLSGIFGELERRGAADGRVVRRFYTILLDAREFREARSVFDRYPDAGLDPFPPLAGDKKGRKIVLRFNENGDGMRAERLSLAGRKIIVVGQPGCAPTGRAFDFIERNEALLTLMKKHGELLAAGSDFKGVRAWNGSRAMKFGLIRSAGDWDGIDFDRYPAFYFVKNGKTIHGFTGWEGEEAGERLEKGLVLLGLSGE